MTELNSNQSDTKATESAKLRPDSMNRSNRRTLAEIRSQFPQYDDLTDGDLLMGIHRKFYSDLHPREFLNRIDGAANVHATISDPALREHWEASVREPMAEEAKADLTLEQKRALAKARARLRAKGEPENSSTGLVGGSSGAALDGFLMGFGDEYLAGLSAVLGIQPDGEGGADWLQYQKPIGQRYETALQQIRDEQAGFSTEHPSTALTAEIAGSLVGPGKGAGRFMKGAESTVGKLYRGTAAGGASAATYGFGEGEENAQKRMTQGLAYVPAGMIAGGSLSAVGQGFSRAATALRNRVGQQQAADTVSAFKSAAQKAYKKAESAGIMIDDRQTQALGTLARKRLRQAGYDEGLHPRIKAVLKRLEAERGSKSLREMEILRRVARNAGGSNQADERRLASILVGSIDEVVERAGGDLSEARGLWKQSRKLEVLEDAIERATTFDDFEKALQSQFRQILRSRKKLKNFDKSEVAAIRTVANGTYTQRALKQLGNLLNLGNVSGASITGAAAYSTGAGAALLPVLGYGARKASGAITKESAAAVMAKVAGASPKQASRKPLAALLPATGPIVQSGD